MRGDQALVRELGCRFASWRYPVYASSLLQLKSRVARYASSSAFSGTSMRSILNTTGRVPSLQTSDHDALVVGPVLHDGAACKRRIDVAAYGVPCLRAGEGRVELSPKVIEVVLSSLALEQVFLSYFKAGAGTAFGVCEIVLLELGEQLLIDDRHFALVLQSCPFLVAPSGVLSCGL